MRIAGADFCLQNCLYISSIVDSLLLQNCLAQGNPSPVLIVKVVGSVLPQNRLYIFLIVEVIGSLSAPAELPGAMTKELPRMSWLLE